MGCFYIKDRMNRKGYSFFLFLQIIFLCCSFSAAGEETKKGDRYSIEKTDWNQEIYFDFEQIPLYDLLNRLAKENHFSFFIDRRVDTELRVTASSESVPIMAALTRLAESAGLEAVRIGSVVYIGPPESGGELLLLIAKHRKTGEREGGLDHIFVPPKGGNYIIPSELLKLSAKRIGYSWIGLDKMPFDCWRTDSIDSIKTRELFLLTLIGYNVDYEIDPGKEKRLKPIPLDREEPVTKSWNAEDLNKISFEDYPRVEFVRLRNEVRGSGPFSDLAKIEYAASKERELRVFRQNDDEEEKEGEEKSRRVCEKMKRVKGEVKQVTLRELAGQLKKDIGLVIILDPELDKIGITFDTRLSCQFDNCGPEETVKVIAEELGVSFRMEGKKGFLFPRK